MDELSQHFLHSLDDEDKLLSLHVEQILQQEPQAGNVIRRLEAENKNLKAENEDLGKDLRALEQEHQGLIDCISKGEASLQTELDRQLGECEKLKKENWNLENEVEVRRKEAEAAVEHSRLLQERVNSIEHDSVNNGVLKEKIGSLEKAIKEKESIDADLQQRHDRLSEELEQVRRDREEELARLRHESQQELAQVRRDGEEELTRVRHDLEEELTRVRRGGEEELARVRHDLEEELARLRANLEQQEIHALEMAEARSGQASELECLKSTNTMLQHQVSNLQKELLSVTGELECSRLESQTVESGLYELTKLQQSELRVWNRVDQRHQRRRAFEALVQAHRKRKWMQRMCEILTKRTKRSVVAGAVEKWNKLSEARRRTDHTLRSSARQRSRHAELKLFRQWARECRRKAALRVAVMAVLQRRERSAYKTALRRWIEMVDMEGRGREMAKHAELRWSLNAATGALMRSADPVASESPFATPMASKPRHAGAHGIEPTDESPGGKEVAAWCARMERRREIRAVREVFGVWWEELRINRVQLASLARFWTSADRRRLSDCWMAWQKMSNDTRFKVILYDRLKRHQNATQMRSCFVTWAKFTNFSSANHGLPFMLSKTQIVEDAARAVLPEWLHKHVERAVSIHKESGRLLSGRNRELFDKVSIDIRLRGINQERRAWQHWRKLVPHNQRKRERERWVQLLNCMRRSCAGWFAGWKALTAHWRAVTVHVAAFMSRCDDKRLGHALGRWTRLTLKSRRLAVASVEVIRLVDELDVKRAMHVWIVGARAASKLRTKRQLFLSRWMGRKTAYALATWWYRCCVEKRLRRSLEKTQARTTLSLLNGQFRAWSAVRLNARVAGPTHRNQRERIEHYEELVDFMSAKRQLQSAWIVAILRAWKFVSQDSDAEEENAAHEPPHSRPQSSTPRSPAQPRNMATSETQTPGSEQSTSQPRNMATSETQTPGPEQSSSQSRYTATTETQTPGPEQSSSSSSSQPRYTAATETQTSGPEQSSSSSSSQPRYTAATETQTPGPEQSSSSSFSQPRYTAATETQTSGPEQTSSQPRYRAATQTQKPAPGRAIYISQPQIASPSTRYMTTPHPQAPALERALPQPQFTSPTILHRTPAPRHASPPRTAPSRYESRNWVDVLWEGQAPDAPPSRLAPAPRHEWQSPDAPLSRHSPTPRHEWRSPTWRQDWQAPASRQDLQSPTSASMRFQRDRTPPRLADTRPWEHDSSSNPSAGPRQGPSGTLHTPPTPRLDLSETRVLSPPSFSPPRSRTLSSSPPPSPPRSERPLSHPRREMALAHLRTEMPLSPRTERPGSHPRTEMPLSHHRTEMPPSPRTERPLSHPRSERPLAHHRTEMSLSPQTEMPPSPPRAAMQHQDWRSSPTVPLPRSPSPRSESTGAVRVGDLSNAPSSSVNATPSPLGMAERLMHSRLWQRESPATSRLVLHWWSSALQHGRQKQRMATVLERRCRASFLAQFWTDWRDLVATERDSHANAGLEDVLTKKISRMRLKTALSVWSQGSMWHRIAAERCFAQYLSIRNQHFLCWLSHQRRSCHIRMKASQAMEGRRRASVAGQLRNWFATVRDIKMLQTIQSIIASRSIRGCVKQHFLAWHEEHCTSGQRFATELAHQDLSRRMNLLREAFSAWLDALEAFEKIRVNLVARLQSRKLWRGFHVWSTCSGSSALAREEEKEEHLLHLAAFFAAKQGADAAEFFGAWQQLVQRRKTSRLSAHLLALRATKCSLTILMHAWRLATSFNMAREGKILTSRRRMVAMMTAFQLWTAAMADQDRLVHAGLQVVQRQGTRMLQRAWTAWTLGWEEHVLDTADPAQYAERCDGGSTSGYETLNPESQLDSTVSDGDQSIDDLMLLKDKTLRVAMHAWKSHDAGRNAHESSSDLTSDADDEGIELTMRAGHVVVGGRPLPIRGISQESANILQRGYLWNVWRDMRRQMSRCFATWLTLRSNRWWRRYAERICSTKHRHTLQHIGLASWSDWVNARRASVAAILARNRKQLTVHLLAWSTFAGTYTGPVRVGQTGSTMLEVEVVPLTTVVGTRRTRKLLFALRGWREVTEFGLQVGWCERTLELGRDRSEAVPLETFLRLWRVHCIDNRRRERLSRGLGGEQVQRGGMQLMLRGWQKSCREVRVAERWADAVGDLYSSDELRDFLTAWRARSRKKAILTAGWEALDPMLATTRGKRQAVGQTGKRLRGALAVTWRRSGQLRDRRTRGGKRLALIAWYGQCETRARLDRSRDSIERMRIWWSMHVAMEDWRAMCNVEWAQKREWGLLRARRTMRRSMQVWRFETDESLALSRTLAWLRMQGGRNALNRSMQIWRTETDRAMSFVRAQSWLNAKRMVALGRRVMDVWMNQNRRFELQVLQGVAERRAYGMWRVRCFKTVAVQLGGQLWMKHREVRIIAQVLDRLLQSTLQEWRDLVRIGHQQHDRGHGMSLPSTAGNGVATTATLFKTVQAEAVASLSSMYSQAFSSHPLTSPGRRSTQASKGMANTVTLPTRPRTSPPHPFSTPPPPSKPATTPRPSTLTPRPSALTPRDSPAPSPAPKIRKLAPASKIPVAVRKESSMLRASSPPSPPFRPPGPLRKMDPDEQPRS